MKKKFNMWMMNVDVVTKNTNLGTIHLVGVDMIENANSILIIETNFI